METLRDWLSSGPFTLAMSSGLFGFYAHTGVACALAAAGFAPARASGSSAGAMVTASWASGVEPEELAERVLKLRLSDFFDPRFGKARSNDALFRKLLGSLIPASTFSECRFPLRVSVFDVRTRRTQVVDSGELLPAVHASCAVPGLLPPVRHQGQVWIDGGVLDRPGLSGVPAGERVFYHHLSSRVPFARVRDAFGRGLPGPRAGLVALELPALPKSDPLRIPAGRRALELAWRATEEALASPIRDGVVQLASTSESAKTSVSRSSESVMRVRDGW
jgi:NTE family protein